MFCTHMPFWGSHLYSTANPPAQSIAHTTTLSSHLFQTWEEIREQGFSPFLWQNCFVNLKAKGALLLVSKQVKGGDTFKREDLTETTTEKPEKRRPEKGTALVREVILTFMSAGWWGWKLWRQGIREWAGVKEEGNGFLIFLGANLSTNHYARCPQRKRRFGRCKKERAVAGPNSED